MAIITISRGSFSMGKVVAEQVAERLGYALVSREVILDASERYNIPEIKLSRAIHDAPGILERYRHKSQSYVAYIRSALMERVLTDNVVYHGLAGHLLLKGVPHVLKVRITSDMERRVKNEVDRERITEQEAYAVIGEDDRQRRKWTKNLYGVDPWDSSLYDLVIRIEKLSLEEVVDVICRAAASEAFKASAEDLRKTRDLALACRVKAMLVDDFPHIGVTSDYGNVLIYSKSRDHGHGPDRLLRRMDDIRSRIDGIYNLEVHAGSAFPQDAV